MASKPPVLILTGYGLNCEAESRHAWELAGADVSFVHLHDILEKPARLHEFGALMFIGGFSFGDHMGAGHALALRLRCRMRDDLQRFIEAGKLILGVCNGFQTMIKLGLLPGLDRDYFTQTLALMQNDVGVFQNFWVRLKFESKSPCVFSRGLTDLPLPIRHGEGKLFTLDRKLLDRIEALNGVVCRYADCDTGERAMEFPANPNGSLNAIAGLCDPTGRIFGLMPHPEAYLFPENHPNWDIQKLERRLPERGLGLQLFRNAVEYLR
ncbi:MAG: phosphoribosylformylglycinamidine synthase subunit PurQ [Lentisphaerae bacterium]|nr:phosphoribosylformylglycinamidine synthase subunit PurQ [Lentisphaerota bacterium]